MAKTPAWCDAAHTSKLCTKCGEARSLTAFYTTGCKIDGSPKYNSWCKTCISKKQSEYHQRTWGVAALQRTAYKRTQSVRAYLTYLRAKAVKRGGACVSLDALETLWAVQEGRCAITGWPMTMELGRGVVQTNASIDRIDSKQGYVPGNVQLVCRCVNIAKSDLTDSDFANMCRAVVEMCDA